MVVHFLLSFSYSLSKMYGNPTSHCPGWSLAIAGNHESVVEFVCDHGKLRTENGLGIKSSELMEVMENYE